MEILNCDTLHTPDRRTFAKSEWKSPARGPRLDRLTIGFWLGGGVLGMGGCILGVCMPYHHPVAVMISALWWGIYLGCLGGECRRSDRLVYRACSRRPCLPGSRRARIIGAAGYRTGRLFGSAGRAG
jgi:hypothetical protein